MTDVFYTLFSGIYGPWLPFGIAMILFATAAWDARTGIVPNIPLLLGAIAIIAGRFMAKGIPDAITHLALGFGTWVVLWALNEAWFHFFKKDAIGMGDAKWTALAATTFGIVPAGLAWIFGSWVSIVWIGFCYLIGRRIKKVYFAPFLFVGLMGAMVLYKKIILLPYPYNLFN
jgi:prepilin signal peptidase PulO-like enzyme (type II secretory pathway)